jgi:Histidine kinase-, DNA gyrase B-, and HSP90-like ATPase
MTDQINEKSIVDESPYYMTIDLRILNHLGIHLYSNVAAVLSEAVANAWDADAKQVKIDFSSEKIVISDDGFGMDLMSINDRFLSVGYDKRSTEGDTSPNGRKFMGRKGIGKLSLFSIADIIDVHTVKGSERHGFRMEVAGIKKSIEKDKTYRPIPIEPEKFEQGTRIVLTGLKPKRTARTVTALKKRVARRFSIIGYEKEGDRFDVLINGEKVTAADREDLNNVEFLWEFGEVETISAKDCPTLKKRKLLSAVVGNNNPVWRVSGWIGTVPEPKMLTSADAGALNNIIVLSRGRLIQENILDKLSFSRILANYLTGQIEADFLDLSEQDDIATSDRQRMIEDDDRYKALVDFMRQTLVNIADEWTAWRNEARGKDAVTENPGLAGWLKELPSGQRPPAQRLLGLIRGVQLEEEEQREDLYKSGVLAFERLRLRAEAHRLGEATALSAASLLPLLSDLADLEGSMYRDIVRSRLDVICKFEGLVDLNEKEKVLQQHLFKNLWLLDPAWDRATGSERIEKRLKTDFKVFSPKLTDKESKGRYDIRYMTNGGMHILVELKRASRAMNVTELLEQGQKYHSALMKCLAVANTTGTENPPISLVFVLGRTVQEEDNPSFGKSYVDQLLRPLNARVVYYEQLIQGAMQAYGDYLRISKETDRIDQIVKMIGEKKQKTE